MQSFTGIILAVISGVLNGSFAAPMKKTTKWQWENVWFMWAIWALIIFPVIVTSFTVSGIFDIYSRVSGGVLLLTFLLGLGYGLGAVTFGLGLHMVGLSLGFTIMVGIISVTGSLIPMLVRNPASLATFGGLLIILAMLVTVAGVALCGMAGIRREKALNRNAAEQKSSYSFTLGFTVCIASGILSAMLNLAFDFGKPIAAQAAEYMGEAASAFSSNNPVWLLVLAGAFIPNCIYCLYLLVQKGSWKNYTLPTTKVYWVWSFLMGAMWISCIVIYGIGASYVGNLGTTVAWIILMSMTVLVGNIWGLLSGEWKAAGSQAKKLMIYGLLLLIGSVILVSAGKYLLSRKASPKPGLSNYNRVVMERKNSDELETKSNKRPNKKSCTRQDSCRI